MTDETLPSKADRSASAILDSAYALFSTQGYAATSMRQIAERAGLALGSIYNHYPSKEAIFEAVVNERHPFLLILPLILEGQGDTVDEFLRSAARSLVAGLGDHPEFLNLMLTEVVEFKGRHVQQLFEKFFPDILTLAGRLAGFQDELRPIPAPLILRAFVGMFFAYFITGMVLKNQMPLEMQANDLDLFLGIFLNGVKQPVGMTSESK